MSGSPLLHVVVGIVINAHDEILIALRPPHKPYPNYWEFPGGKIEPHETPLQALAREFKEEINLTVLDAQPLMTFEYQYPDRRVLLEVWTIQAFSGELCGMEGQTIQWIARESLRQYKFPEGNNLIIEKLLGG